VLQKTMTLIDSQTQKRYKCCLITAERASYEKVLRWPMVQLLPIM